MKAMIFAAGLGTRLLDETSDKPKALVEVGGTTLLEYSIQKCREAGISEVILNVHHFSERVKQFIASHNFGLPVHISDESDRLLETGGGLKKAASFFRGEDHILLYNVDIISDLDLGRLMDTHIKSGAMATLAVSDRKSDRYFKFNRENQLVGWINKKTGETKISIAKDYETATEKAFSGIHVIRTELVEDMPEQEAFSITPFYLEAARSKRILAYPDNSTFWMDLGSPAQLQLAREQFPNGLIEESEQ